MKAISFIVLLVCMQTSILIHIQSLIGYISLKDNKYFKRFIATTLTNTTVGVILAIFVVLDSSVLKGLRLDMMLVLESGLIFFYMIFIKISIVVKIFKRMKDPQNFHLSHFGKKVYEKKVVEPREIFTFVITLPFTLFAGAYFVVKVVF